MLVKLSHSPHQKRSGSDINLNQEVKKPTEFTWGVSQEEGPESMGMFWVCNKYHLAICEWESKYFDVRVVQGWWNNKLWGCMELVSTTLRPKLFIKICLLLWRLLDLSRMETWAWKLMSQDDMGSMLHEWKIQRRRFSVYRSFRNPIVLRYR